MAAIWADQGKYEIWLEIETLACEAQAEIGVVPWLMDASHYQAAAQRGAAVLELSGTPVAASWNPPLGAVMTRFGVAVHEEAVLDDLLACITSFA